MRRVTLTVFFCLAACGGTDMVNQSRSSNQGALDRQAYLLTAEGAAVIASFTGQASEAAIDACLSAWVDGDGPGGPAEGPVEKPGASSLRRFLVQCLADSPSGDARTANAAPEARSANRTVNMRRAGVGGF